MLPVPPPSDSARGGAQPDRAGPLAGQGDAPPGRSAREPDPAAAALADTFSHQISQKLTCITCHSTTSQEEQPHLPAAPRLPDLPSPASDASRIAATCHKTDEIEPARSVTVEVTVPRQTPRERPVSFEHGRHADLACTAVSHHASDASSRSRPWPRCRACHDNHHTAGVDCATCHRTEGIIQAHAPPVDAHRACSECHTAATVAALEPTRSFCLACHSSQADHYQPKECTVCHLQASPDEYRARLTEGGP